MVRTRKAVYQVKRMNPLDEKDAAFINRALQEQAREDEDGKQQEIQSIKVDEMDVDTTSQLDDVFDSTSVIEIPSEDPAAITHPQ